MTTDVRLERGEGVARIVIDGPDTRNGMTLESWQRLGDVVRDVATNQADRVVVLTGAGGTFCSGAHLTSDRPNAVSPLSRMDVVNDSCRALHHLAQPTIAAVSGYAVGAGLSLALACDLVICDDTARLSAMFVKRGFSIDCGGSWSLVNRIGLQRAKELVLFGRMLTGAEAERMGLVNRLVAEDELDEALEDWTRELARLPPVALAQNKRLVDLAVAGGFDDALLREAAAQQLNGTTADTREAIAAYLERREARYRGF